MKTQKSIATEIWESKDSQNFYGKKMMLLINRATGKTETFVLERTDVDIRYKYDGDLDPEETYGANGCRRAVWIEEKISQQTKEEKEIEAIYGEQN
mgnify:CR=1 FL=1